MNRIFLLITCFVFSHTALSNEAISQIQSADPDAFADAKASCEQWADDDQTPPEEMNTYINNCIIDMLGYLVESSDESE